MCITLPLPRNNYPANTLGLLGKAGQFCIVLFLLAQTEDQAAVRNGVRSLKETFARFLNFDFNPTEAMMDACLALRIGFTDVFPDIRLAVCFFHMMQALVRNKNRFRDAEQNYPKFRADVRGLHTLDDSDAFQAGLDLLKRRWQAKEPLVVSWFFPHWGVPGKMEWNVSATAWGMPAVNNANESNNNSFKRFATKRTRPGLGILLPMIQRELEYQAKRAPVNFHRERVLGKADFVKAQEWLHLNRALIFTRSGVTYVPSGHSARELRAASSAVRTQTLRAWRERETQPLPRESVDAFVKRHKQFYSLVPMGDERGHGPDQLYKCSCPMAWKTGQCKHALAVAIARKQVQVRDAWCLVSPNVLPSRGRPRNADTQQGAAQRRRRR